MDFPGELTHRWDYQGRTITFTWLGEVDVVSCRVYGLAYTTDARMLLVGGGPGDLDWWLPGGGVEDGETPEEALGRELEEEAAAAVEGTAFLGVQRVEDDAGACEHHSFYWCRITLSEDFRPRHEVTKRKLVDPSDFLDGLFWGRTDPKAALLLAKSLEIDRRYRDDG
jgi:ADP-ribose pyrophosphatase YjhB (NUDIX family)